MKTFIVSFLVLSIYLISSGTSYSQGQVQDCSLIKCPNAYYDVKLQKCVCGQTTSVRENCSLLKCPFPYFDEKLQSCACGGKQIEVGRTNKVIKAEYFNNEGKASKIILNDAPKVEITTEEKNIYIFDKNKEIGTSSSMRVKVMKNVDVKDGAVFLNEKAVKIMPDTASNVAIEKLGLKNITIELKDTGKPEYQMDGQKQVKLFGLFKKEMRIKTSVSAETGEIIKIDRPWWGFLAKED